MLEIFDDHQFQEYRVKEIEEGIQFLRDMPNKPPEYFYGAMDMLRKILSVPLKMVPENNNARMEQAKTLKAKALAAFESKMLRRFLEDE